MILELPDHAQKLANAIIALAKKLSSADEATKSLFMNMCSELNVLFSPVAHPFFENVQFAEMFTDWKLMYNLTEEMLPEQQKIFVLQLVKLSENNVEKSIAIMENAIRYKFLVLSKSAEKMPKISNRSIQNIALQPKATSTKVTEICQKPSEILGELKHEIKGKKIRCEKVDCERAIEFRSQLTGYTVNFTPDI